MYLIIYAHTLVFPKIYTHIISQENLRKNKYYFHKKINASSPTTSSLRFVLSRLHATLFDNFGRFVGALLCLENWQIEISKVSINRHDVKDSCHVEAPHSWIS